MIALVLAAALSQTAPQPPTIGLDKVLHAGVSAGLTLGSYWLLREAGASKEAAVLAAIAFPVAVGLAYELGGNNDAADLGADMIGIIPALVLSVSLDDGCVALYTVTVCPD